MTNIRAFSDEPEDDDDELSCLAEWESDEDLSQEDLIEDLYDFFEKEWEKSQFTFQGKRVKVNLNPSKVYGYKGYPDAFVHLITRESKIKQQRQFDSYRACRLHWIKTVLNHAQDPRIWYYEFEESDGTCKQYYWYEKQDYLIILKPVEPDVLLVTAFCIDSQEKQMHRKRFQKYRDGLKK